ncbi:S-layer domain protein [Methanosarcina mazei Tuc01]|uniref:S-layer domain protein n=1 Tax=Methanosarcina mazei Tuc01 TaxID=1236903 RepID=M1QHE1_METMZ|nr:COG1361 S-layer family protein [Methanosarcina mazei]AGF96379.1 S-layer domain protein [Methanosarcina mazei Tuc01]
MGLIKERIIATFFSLLLVASVFAFPASAAVGSANLKVTIVETNPYPAKIGEYLTLNIQVENVGGAKADNIDIEVVPEFPFSLDSKENARQNIGALNPGRTATKEFYLFVDKSAKKGTRSIDIRTRTSPNDPWSEQSFDIRVGTETFTSKGTVELAEIVSSPEVFMPGDEGTVTVTLKNTATAATVSIDGKDYDTNARIQAAVLRPLSDGIRVQYAPYYEMGLLGPGESIKLTFNIEVEEDAREGVHNLELDIEGNSYDYNSRKNIPLKVDSSNIKVITSKPLELINGQATVEFDVANTHPNELNSVSIRPAAEGLKFYPAEYFIGPMDPDELFTIKFDAVRDNSSGSDNEDSEGINMSVTASYNNGINRHENVAGNLEFATDSLPSEGNSTVAIAGVIAVIFIPAAVLLYRRKKQ